MANLETEAARGVGRPRLIDSDEFKQAVEEQVTRRLASAEAETSQRIDQAIQGALAQFATSMISMQKQGVPSGDVNFAKEIAMNIAELANQGSMRVRVAPEEMVRRDEGRKRMEELIQRAAAAKIRVEWRVTTHIYDGNQTIEPYRIDPVTKQTVPTVGHMLGVPSEALIPMNDAAKEIFDAFMQSIGGSNPESRSGEDQRPMSITSEGFVVYGELGQGKRVIGNHDGPRANSTTGFEPNPIPHMPNDPMGQEVRILGKTMAPVRMSQTPLMTPPGTAA